VDACLIVNRKSRRAERWLSRLEPLLSARKLDIRQSHFFEGRQGLLAAGAAARDSGCPLVLVGGGDGTISSLAPFFAETEVKVGLLPLGTGNALAFDLGIPNDLEGACDVIVNGTVREIDLGRVDDAYFVNHVAIGASTLVSRSLNPHAKRWVGKLAYLSAAFRAYIRVKPFTARIRLDDELLELKTIQVVLGNGRHHAGPFLLTPNASLESGQLVAYVLETTDRRRLVELVRRLRRGDHTEMPDVHPFTFHEGEIRTRRPVRVSVDGEVRRRTPIEFSVVPQGLRILAPPTRAV
jgi:YegS/Rv2252/BmrU family lipid kinase